MAAAVTFDYDAWIEAFPMFASGQPQYTTQAMAQGYFDRASLYWRNDGTSPTQSAAVQLQLMWLLTAHLAALYSNRPANMPVGRLASAGEGSVNASYDYPSNPSAAWFNQTQFGAEFWQATASWRTARYRARPQSFYGNSNYGPYYPGGRMR